MRARVALGAALVIAGAFGALGLTFTADPTAHFPRSSPNVLAWLELSLRFDAFNTLIIGLEEPTAPLTSDGVGRVKKITDQLSAMKANGVLAVASVTNVESIREGADGSLETELLIPAIPADRPGLEALSKKIAGNPQVSGALISHDQRGYVIVLRADPRRDSAELAAAIRATVDAHRGALSATFFGAPFFQAVVTKGLQSQLSWLAHVLLVLFFGALGFAVRRVQVIARVLVPSGLSLVVWAGLVRLGGMTLSPTSSTAALAVFVLAATVFARRLEGPVLSGLVAAGAGAVGLMEIAPLATFGAATALGAIAIAVVLGLIVVPLSPAVAASPLPPLRPKVLGLAALAIAGAGFVARTLPLHGTPQRIFAADDDVGRSISFFDRRFGGPDFIQVDFRGDLREPEVAARLLRLTDLLEGPHGFPDVRAVAPVLAFLNHGFGGVHRIPTSRESLNNLWFFLEGRPDVRNLVSDKRDEAMVVLRVPSQPSRPAAELAAQVEAAVAASVEPSERERLAALARMYELDAAQIDAALAASAPDVTAEVSAGLKKWLGSGDSPYQPSEAQWSQLAAALAAGDVGELTAAASSFPELGGDDASQLVESVLAREKDLRLALQAQALADRCWPGAPAAARIRAQGIFADHLDPQNGSGKAAVVTVTGLPIVAAQIERDSLANLWRALGVLLVIGFGVQLGFTRSPPAALRALIEAALAGALTCAAGALWLGADPGSATVFLIPSMVAFAASGGRLPAKFLLAIALASGALLFVGVLPVERIGWALAAGAGAVALIGLTPRRGA